VGVIAAVNPANGPGAAADPPTRRDRAPQRRRHQGHRLRGHRLRDKNAPVVKRTSIAGRRSTRPDRRDLLRRAVEPRRRRRVLPRPVAAREGAGDVVHRRQSGD
jgi:hypothetical protein